MSTRKSADFSPGKYLISLSPTQLDELLGGEIGATVRDHYCRISPQDPTELDLWVTTSSSPLDTYEHSPVDRPRGWKPYTVDGVYRDNDHAYTQTVLATDHGMAEEEAQRIVWFAAQGRTDEDGFFEMLHPDYIEANQGYGEKRLRRKAAPVSVRNANTYPDQLVQLAAWALLDPRYERFNDEDGPYGEETFREGVERVTQAALAFFNELPQSDADNLQDEDCARFRNEFYATQHDPIA